jgi:anaerobic selenocysteine-containing dehydrogenase
MKLWMILPLAYAKHCRRKRNNEIAYHVGRPGHEGYANRVLQAWGVDGHNSHTNICSSGARFGYNIWYGYDRPSPDHSEAKFILLISAHLESGHYFNPHAQRIIEAKMKGAKLACMDPRLSNTASMSDYWLPTYPGSEAALCWLWPKSFWTRAYTIAIFRKLDQLERVPEQETSKFATYF